jgi:two-component system alkaline phosphatase synthesis response regulator PhoP
MAVTARRSAEPGAPPARILFVEDVLEEREPAIESLRTHGYMVDEATDGGQAVRLAAKFPPDVIVMDVSLPVMDGIEAIRRIRALGVAKRPHVIVMSGQVDARTRQLAFEAGCDQYIVKPCGIDALTSAVNAYFVKRDGRE